MPSWWRHGRGPQLRQPGSLPGGGTGDHGGGGTMNMPECDECTMPNPPTHCYDDEEEDEEEIPCKGDPIRNPKIAPSNGWNYLGGQYGYTRNSGNTFHDGIDIKADLNSGLYSMHAGIVIDIRDSFEPGEYAPRSYGNYITIESEIDDIIIQLMYAHLNSLNVNVGDLVDQGQLIGISGNTGNAQSTNRVLVIPHVHIRARKKSNGNLSRIDPAQFMATRFNSDGSINTSETNCN